MLWEKFKPALFLTGIALCKLEEALSGEKRWQELDALKASDSFFVDRTIIILQTDKTHEIRLKGEMAT